ncbi:hypothetical protein EV672_11078 [Aquabacterium commune]|uniref:Uncharacterized protein n=1 Tax=Aquabacterium commune TaxID=70586 RepID=A0A4R6R4T1_9BURK|nr:hypothetical protein [Aquabacterium commune]TDP80863.1 hypothetical protein EV672_11078 [Aquabacterium commune]
MDTDRIEDLLERLIDKQDDIIRRLESIETVLDAQLGEANVRLSRVEEELNWWEDKPTLAKQLLSALEHIDRSVNEVNLSVISTGA